MFPEPKRLEEVKSPVLSELGPQKKCPANPQDKWDEDYLTRKKLPTGTPVLYVDASSALGGTGEKSKPFRSIASAVARASSGTVVLVAPGSYHWGVEISKPIHLVGRCADGVKIVAKSTSQGYGMTWLVPAMLEGFSFDARAGAQASQALVIPYGGEVREARFDSVRGAAIIARNGNLLVEFCDISNTRFGGISRQYDGTGLLALRTQRTVVRSTRFFRNVAKGAIFFKVKEVSVVKSSMDKNGTDGLYADSDSKVVVEDCRVVGNARSGLYMHRAQDVRLSRNLLRGNGTPANQTSFGYGFFCQPTRKLEVDSNRIEENVRYGGEIFGTHVETLEVRITGNSFLRNGQTAPVGWGMSLQKVRAAVTIQNNLFVQNAAEGLRMVHLILSKLTVEGNEFRANGQRFQTKGGMFVIDTKIADTFLFRGNRVVEHPTVGIIMTKVETQHWHIHGNWFENNNQSKYHKPVGHIQMVNGVGELQIRGNVIQGGATVGVYSEGHSGAVEVSYNTIEDTPHVNFEGTFLNRLEFAGSGILITHATANVVIQGNDIHRTNVGISIGNVTAAYTLLVQDNRLAHSRFEGGGASVQCVGYGVALYKFFGKSQFLHNVIEEYASTGIYLEEVPNQILVEGNQFLNTSKRCVAHEMYTTNPQIFTYFGELIFRNNRSYSLISGGSNIAYLRHLVWEHNEMIVEEQATKDSIIGLRVFRPYRAPQIQGNIFRGYYTGTKLSHVRLHDKQYSEEKVLLRDNIWADCRSQGLVLDDISVDTLLEGNLFEHNGGTHLSVVSSLALITVKQSGFANGVAATKEQDEKTWLSGVGVWGGAGNHGLVRWAYAQAKTSCSIANTRQVSDGWTLRLVRVPVNMDPCEVHDVGVRKIRYRTQEQRKQASLCQKCYAQNKGCRWVWKDAGVGEAKGKGLWKPATESIVCVDKSLPDSCVNPPKLEEAQKPSLSLQVKNGQCRRLEVDPCAKLSHCAPKPGYVCVRTGRFSTQENKMVYSAECLRKDDPLIPYCLEQDRQSVCESGFTCIHRLAEFEALTVAPSNLSLQGNVFWNNAGPDVLMDMAGKVQLNNNLYLYCFPGQKGCKPKFEYHKTLSQQAKDNPTAWKKVDLPTSATLVWREPSPYPAPHQSRLEGNDLFRKVQGLPVLWRPNLCSAIGAATP